MPVATAAPPVPDNRVIFLDRFVDNQNNWYRSQDPSAPARVENGHYLFGSNAGGFRFATMPVPLDQDRDFRIQCTVTKISGTEDFFYGLIWGLLNGDNFFNLAITASGHVAVTRKKDGRFSDFMDTSRVHSAVRQGNSANHLLVSKSGDRLRFFVNEREIHEMPFEPLLGPGIGFVVYHNILLTFDDLRVEGVRLEGRF